MAETQLVYVLISTQKTKLYVFYTRQYDSSLAFLLFHCHSKGSLESRHIALKIWQIIPGFGQTAEATQPETQRVYTLFPIPFHQQILV